MQERRICLQISLLSRTLFLINLDSFGGQVDFLESLKYYYILNFPKNQVSKWKNVYNLHFSKETIWLFVVFSGVKIFFIFFFLNLFCSTDDFIILIKNKQYVALYQTFKRNSVWYFKIFGNFCRNQLWVDLIILILPQCLGFYFWFCL